MARTAILDRGKPMTYYRGLNTSAPATVREPGPNALMRPAILAGQHESEEGLS